MVHMHDLQIGVDLLDQAAVGGALLVELEVGQAAEAGLQRGQASVGASGDLAPLAHMAAVMMGHGEAEFAGETISGGEALVKESS